MLSCSSLVGGQEEAADISPGKEEGPPDGRPLEGLEGAERGSGGLGVAGVDVLVQGRQAGCVGQPLPLLAVVVVAAVDQVIVTVVVGGVDEQLVVVVQVQDVVPYGNMLDLVVDCEADQPGQVGTPSGLKVGQLIGEQLVCFSLRVGGFAALHVAGVRLADQVCQAAGVHPVADGRLGQGL